MSKDQLEEDDDTDDVSWGKPDTNVEEMELPGDANSYDQELLLGVQASKTFGSLAQPQRRLPGP